MIAHSMQCMYTHTYQCTAYIYWAGFQREECAQTEFSKVLTSS